MIIRPMESKHGRGKVHIGATTTIRTEPTLPGGRFVRVAGYMHVTACLKRIKRTKLREETGTINCTECLHALGLLTNTGEPTP